MHRLTLFLIILVSLCSPRHALPQASPHIIGVLRYDAIVEPFAVMSMSDTTWNSISDFYLNILASNQPLFYFHFNADSVETIQIGTRVIFDPNGMNSGEGFLSSFSDMTPGYNCCYPKPKAGIVLNWRPPLAVFVSPKSGGHDISSVESNITKFFRATEQEIIDNNNHYEVDGVMYASGIPVSQSTRDTLKINIRYQITDESLKAQKYVYFNAVRAYPSSGCGPNTGQLQGWGVIYGHEIEIMNQSFSIGDCDGKGLVELIEPHIAFEVLGKVYIASTLTYYEGEGRQIFEVQENGLIPLLSNH